MQRSAHKSLQQPCDGFSVLESSLLRPPNDGTGVAERQDQASGGCWEGTFDSSEAVETDLY